MRADAWAGVWSFFCTEYRKIPGKFELLASLGYHGVQELKSLWDSQKTKHLANLKKLKDAYLHSGQDSKALRTAKAARDKRLVFLDPIHCKTIDFDLGILDSLAIISEPDLPSVRRRKAAEKEAAEKEAVGNGETAAAVEDLLKDSATGWLSNTLAIRSKLFYRLWLPIQSNAMGGKVC